MIIDIQKQTARLSRRNAPRTFIISAAHRGSNSNGSEWDKWSVTNEVYAVVTAPSPFDALMDYLRSRPDMVNEAKYRWSYDAFPSFMAGQRVWAVIGVESFPEAQRLVRDRKDANNIGDVRFIRIG